MSSTSPAAISRPMSITICSCLAARALPACSWAPTAVSSDSSSGSEWRLMRMAVVKSCSSCRPVAFSTVPSDSLSA